MQMLRKFKRYLASKKEGLKLVAAVLLLPVALALLVTAWRYCLALIGQPSVARIESVNERYVRLSFTVPGGVKQLKISTPYSGLAVGERYELRYNPLIYTDAVVLYWRPVYQRSQFRLIKPLHYKTDTSLLDTNVTVSYRVGNATWMRQLRLPPHFDRRKLPGVQLLYEVKRPQIAYLLAE